MIKIRPDEEYYGLEEVGVAVLTEDKSVNITENGEVIVEGEKFLNKVKVNVQVDTHEGEIAELEAQILELEGQKEELQNEVDELQNQKAELESELQTATGIIASKDEQIGELNSQIEGLNSRIGELNEQIEGLNTQIGELNSQVSELQAEVERRGQLQSKTITENGTYTPDEGYYALGQVEVNVQGGGTGNLQEKDVVVDKNGLVDKTDYVTIRYYEFAAGYCTWNNIEPRAGRVQKVLRGQTVEVIAGQDVSAVNRDSLSSPAMTFIGWDSPIDIIDNTITIPEDWDEGDVEIYGNYVFDQNYYVNNGSTTLSTGYNSTSTLPVALYRKDWDGMPTSGNTRYMRYPIILSGDFHMTSDIQFCSGYKGLTELILPMSIGFIGTQDGAASYSSSCYYDTFLRKVHLPNNLTIIGLRAFNTCHSLSEINMPSHLERIEQAVFAGCMSLKNITLPKTMKYIGTQAFYNCYYLRYLRCKAIVPPTLGDNPFQGAAIRYIYVPDQSVDAYKEAWSQYADYIYPESEYNN